MKTKDAMKSSGAWLLFPKGQEHITVSQPPAPGGPLLAVADPTPSAVQVLMTFVGEQNKLKSVRNRTVVGPLEILRRRLTHIRPPARP
jgi:hypothetical protein